MNIFVDLACHILRNYNATSGIFARPRLTPRRKCSIHLPWRRRTDEPLRRCLYSFSQNSLPTICPLKSFRTILTLLALALVVGGAGIFSAINSLARNTDAELVRATEVPAQRVAMPAAPTKFARSLPVATTQPSVIPTRFIPSPTPAPSNTPVSTKPAARTIAPIKKQNAPLAQAATLTVENTATIVASSTPAPTFTATATRGVISAQSISGSGTCAPIPSVNYNGIEAKPSHPDRPAEQQADLNLRLRGYAPTTGVRGLISLDGATDGGAPQLYGLFADQRTPAIRNLYHVYDWDWGSNSRGGAITDPEVTLIGVDVSAGETIYMPDSGANIGEGNEALVLYASATRLTLKFTGEDNVERGYTLQLEGVCVEPRLLALYQQLNAAGRGELPALRPHQAIGRAAGDELGIAIRDSGTFMDPRSRKDWWRGR